MLQERNEQSPETTDFPLMAFIANVGVAPKGERYDRSALVKSSENKKYKKTKYGDFIYSSNNLESGSIGLNKYGNASISPVYSIFSTKDESDSNFIGRYFLRTDFIGRMIRWRQGVVYGQWKIPESDFLNMDVYVPSKFEQSKIGKILDKIDSTITLQQRKLNSLQKLKKGLLQKMFPKNGENIPEIRFPEFSDAWKQRELKDLAENKIGGGTPSTKINAYWNGDLPWIQSSDIEEGIVLKANVKKKITKLGLDKSSAKLVPEKSIAIVTRVGVGKLAYMPYQYSTSQDFLSLSNLKEDHFFLTYLLYKTLNEGANSQGTSIKGITKDYLLSINMFVPSKDEQRKIGKLFSKIDTTITLQQRWLFYTHKQS